MKKSLLLSLSLALVLFVASPVQSLVVDAPHNTTNNISCATCHSYSLWWQYSPTNQSSNPDHATIVDAVCMTCHDGSHDQPLALTHASSVVGTFAHGTWGVGCTECHNPHSQEQLSWVGSGSTPYLVTGTIASVSYAAAPLDQTTILFTGASSNSNWPPVGALSSDQDWANKSVAYPDRGLILVHDTTLRANTFAIVSATANQVVIKGHLPSEEIDPNYVDPQTQAQNPASCNTFGLIYGQLIKSTIAAKPVKFFDPNGGFVQEGAATTGICQVCHTQTSRYTADGSLPSTPDSHADRSTGNCMSCHLHSAGIGRGTAHDDNAFAWDGNCATCHKAGGTQVNIVTTTHANNCGSCHLNPAGGGPLTAGDPANGVDGTAVGAVATDSCLTCHTTRPSLSSGAIHHTSASGYAAAGDCTHCHQDAVGKLPADHTLTIATSADCSGCHAQTAGTANGAPVDPANAGIHDACTTCHDTDGALKQPYGKASAMPAGGGGCEACHGAYFDNHTHAHNVAVGPYDYFAPDYTSCSVCHSANTWFNIRMTHLGQCSTCHSATRDVNPSAPTGTTVQMVIANAQQTIRCLNCHKEHFDPHNFTPDGNCRDCHSVDYGMDIHSFNCGLCHVNPSGGGPRRAGTDGSAIAAVGTSTCTFCHDTTIYPPGFVHHDTINAVNGNCNTCHFWTNHRGNHTDFVADSPACASCHPATAGSINGAPVSTSDDRVHDACTTCHESNGALKEAYGKASAMPMGGGTCTDCHGNYFNGHSHDHLNQVKKNTATSPATANCVGCHTATTPPFTGAGQVHAVHGCATCHSATDGSLLAPAVAGGGECVSCHSTYFNGHQQHNALTHDVLMRATDLNQSSPCNACHRRGGTGSVNPNFINSWSGSGGILALHQNSCALCHDSTRTTNVAPGYGSVSAVIRFKTQVGCLDCHNTHFDPHAFVANGNCSGCHSTDYGVDVHNAQCALCHVNPAGGGPRRVGVDGDATLAVSGQTASCLTCHPTATFPGGAMHHDTANAVNGNCVACHSASSLHGGDHSAAVAAAPSCTLASCHPEADIVGTTIRVPVSATDNKVHDACTTCHETDGALKQPYGKAIAMPASGGACTDCHGAYSHPGFVHTLPTVGVCLGCHAATTAPYVASGDVHSMQGCSTCHDVLTGVLIGSAVGHHNGATCEECHTSFITHPFDHAPVVKVNSATTPTTANCIGCHQATTSPFVISGDVHAAQGCSTCHNPATGVLIGSASGKTQGGECVTCHSFYFNGHNHGNNHDVQMQPDDISEGWACNSCHRRGGVSSGWPLFTNTWLGSDGILALHQNSCALCHNSTRSTDIGFPYTSVNNVIMTGVGIGCLTCHADRVTHPDPHDFIWDGNCSTCHPQGNDVHGAQCALCHVNPSGGGARRSGNDGDATAAVSGQPTSCLTCHSPSNYPSDKIHHDTNTAANNNCTTCHPTVNHGNLVQMSAACADCHPNTAGTTSGIPVDMANDRLHHSCRTCHTFNPITLAGELVAPTGNGGVTAMPIGSSATNDGGGPCTVCHTMASAGLHHNDNGHALIGECEYCHADPRNRPGTYFQEVTLPSGSIPTHLPCEECHVKPKRGAVVNGWTATSGQMTIYAYQEGTTHSTTNYNTDFPRTTAHSGGHVIANTVGQINNWGICLSCHDGSGLPGHAVQVRQFHAKPTALAATNLSCGDSGTSRYAPGREARNTIGNFDFFASSFRPASTRPGGSGSCRQSSDWANAVKYGSTNFPASDFIVPDPWSTAINTVPMFPEQTANSTSTPLPDNVKVTAATWDSTNIVVTATNTSGCTALTAVYDGSSQPFTGTTTCTATFPGTVVYSPSVPTVSVSTSNPKGLGVNGYRITVTTSY